MRARDDRVGLNAWAPTVNLLRHPLWGRDEEATAAALLAGVDSLTDHGTESGRIPHRGRGRWHRAC
ncbi:hypothetical protein GCM10010260_57860 [Streptomyces filipinensis]|uniref:Uncharacterized protein n=1 Tax=Streptomyces filipinensis TaxID=66887 RepID=A0A918MDZ6_9ACTN|nr:hypothetical protein GCM10010260_57860 [Streptomyces filipinensis]